jgi:IS605 OrfB family transposase
LSKRTYHTLVPENIIPFCEEMGELFGWVERCLYKDLMRGRKRNKLKKEYQLKYGINARQFNSIYFSVKGKIDSRKECHTRQIKQIAQRIVDLEKSIRLLEKRIDLTKRDKRIKKVGFSCAISPKKISPRQSLLLAIHQKKRKLEGLKIKENKLKNKSPSLIFGGGKLWKAQFNLSAQGYSCHEHWRKEWQKARSSNFLFVGSSDEKCGNQICQLNEKGELKIRVPHRLEPRFGKLVVTSGLKFAYGQAEIEYALCSGSAITMRFSRKNHKWYRECTVDVPDTPQMSNKKNGVMGIDLNPGVIGWAICDGGGNLLKKGQIKINIISKNTAQTSAILGDAVRDLVLIASELEVPIVVEKLDFSRKKSGMKEQGVRYSRMLSNFAYSKFYELLERRSSRYGIELILRNPAYSSLIGLTKYMSMYGLSSDTAAALVLARRGLYLSERLPANYASLVQGDTNKHVWSFWSKLNKKLKGRKRHCFFSFNVTNSQLEVNLSDELCDNSDELCDNRFDGKLYGTSFPRWDSSA